MKFFNYIKCKNSEEFIFKFVSLVSFFALAIFMIYIINNYEYIFPFNEGLDNLTSDSSETANQNPTVSEIDHVDDVHKTNYIDEISKIVNGGNNDTFLDKIDEYRILNSSIIIDSMLKGLDNHNNTADDALNISQRINIENAFQDGVIDRIISYIPQPT
tara:strand:+ start:908 stop:1384 length:477 start_codon:yes stop_codon:yes gene_type:complete